MKGWLQQRRSGKAQQKLRSLAEWELTRKKGRGRFVWRTALTYCAILIPAVGYYEYFFHGRMLSWQSEEFWSEAGRYLLTGFAVGYVAWASREREYKKAKSAPTS